MGKHQLRNDKTCLNCRQVVEKRFCPNCGQENTDTRKTFHHLFIHFFEDLTHYENAFWKTIRNLLFRPGSLTSEYLSGKRLSYLAPVRLYIFISFVTFLLMGLLPYKDAGIIKFKYKAPNGEEVQVKDFNGINDLKKLQDSIVRAEVKDADTILAISSLPNQNANFSDKRIIGDYSSQKEFDSIQQSLPVAKRATGITKWVQRKLAKINETTTPEEFREKFTESIVHNIPKALFLYMPFFALVLWIFHNKKRWYYFDHGIFTLHYFSFILLTLSIYLIIKSALSYISESLDGYVNFLALIMMIWWFFYFFRSHRRYYLESKLVSRVKSFCIFFINFFFLLFFMVALMLYSAINIH